MEAEQVFPRLVKGEWPSVRKNERKMRARSKPELGTVRFRLMREDSDDGKKGRAQQCDPSNQPAIRLLLFLCCSASLLQISNSLFFLCIYIILHRLHSRCWKYYSVTPAGTSFTRDSLSLSRFPPSFYSSLSALPFRLLFGWWLGIGSRCVFYVRDCWNLLHVFSPPAGTYHRVASTRVSFFTPKLKKGRRNKCCFSCWRN
jgi:hypothetical protein